VTLWHCSVLAPSEATAKLAVGEKGDQRGAVAERPRKLLHRKAKYDAAMWNSRPRTHRKVRIGVGTLALAGALILPFASDGASNPTVLAGQFADVAAATLDPDSRRLELAPEADAVSRIEDSLVYTLNADGTGVVAGRVIRSDGKLFVTLNPKVAAAYRGAARLLVQPPVTGMGDMIGLMLGPGGMEAELELAREQLLPVIEQYVLPDVRARVTTRLKALVASLPEKEAATLNAAAETLTADLEPELIALTGRLGDKAWSTLGVMGAAEGVGRKALDSAENAWTFVRGLFGSEGNGGVNRSFLSEARTKEMAAAMMEETRAYLNENGQVVLQKVGRVLESSSGPLFSRMEREWLPELFADVTQAFNGQAVRINSAISEYARDVIARKLANKAGAPTLAVAYAARSGLGLTRRPLLVLEQHDRRDDSLVGLGAFTPEYFGGKASREAGTK
jgi:hypothetical protein